MGVFFLNTVYIENIGIMIDCPSFRSNAVLISSTLFHFTQQWLFVNISLKSVKFFCIFLNFAITGKMSVDTECIKKLLDNPDTFLG